MNASCSCKVNENHSTYLHCAIVMRVCRQASSSVWHSSAIQPFSAGYQWQQTKQGNIPLISTIFQLLLGDPKVFPNQIRHLIFPVCSGSTLVSLTSWAYLENLQRKTSWSDDWNTSICLFLSKGAVALLQAPPRSITSSPATLQNKLILAFCIHSLILLGPIKVMAIRHG